MSQGGVDKVKLVYFEGVRGKGEFIGLVLRAGGVELEDVRIPFDQWKSDPSYKKEAPHGMLPYAVYRGRKITQSIPIASYFAKKCGLYGKSDEDALRQGEVMHLVEDLRLPNLREWYMAPDATKKAEIEQKLSTEVFPRYLGYLETLLKDNGDSGFFVGDSVTLADIYVYEMMVTVQGIDPEALTSFPLLRKMCDNVTSFPPLKEHLATRPFYKL